MSWKKDDNTERVEFRVGISETAGEGIAARLSDHLPHYYRLGKLTKKTRVWILTAKKNSGRYAPDQEDRLTELVQKNNTRPPSSVIDNNFRKDDGWVRQRLPISAFYKLDSL